jgi:hypothetical protein
MAEFPDTLRKLRRSWHLCNGSPAAAMFLAMNKLVLSQKKVVLLINLVYMFLLETLDILLKSTYIKPDFVIIGISLGEKKMVSPFK